jgi:FtsP/CotA-like multicopper oxidase with cupredoxin domain
MREQAAAKQGTVKKGLYTPVPGGQPNYFGPEPNFANSPLPLVKTNKKRQIKSITGIRKFVDSLPGLGSSNKNNLGQYIPVATPNTAEFPDADYYELGVVEYHKQMHSDLGNTTLRGYVQLNPVPGATNPSDAAQYLGPLIIARKDRPVRVKFTNLLPTGPGGDLFIPVDTTVMGAGMGPSGGSEMYTQNRTNIHLHGGLTPWISDGTPHQWITPAGEMTSYPQGVSVQPVPDMPSPGPGSNTLYYPNQQSSRFMFYHDHTYGITRLNVYAGEAAGYLLTDSVEEDLINRHILPNLHGVYRYGIPLIIQDKTFVPPHNQLMQQDPTWNYLTVPGSLWFPHVYMPNQNPNIDSGANPLGRWDYGPWFWPPFNAGAGLIHGPIFDISTGMYIPGTPNPSIVPEAFLDTPVVNGTAYPYLEVHRKPYRFRILNACNDRFLNLQLYYAEPLAVSVIDGGSGYTKAPKVHFKGGHGKGAQGEAAIQDGKVVAVTITDPGSGYTSAPTVVFKGGGKHAKAAVATASINTEVRMIPASPTAQVPPYYPMMDGRAGGVPDPTTSGPSMIQIGTEGGFLPAPVVLPNTPIGYQYNRRDITVLNVLEKTLFLGPAERADVIVDFSQVPKHVSTIILYNDAPAPVPGFDPRNDYYTNNPDQTSTGGAPTTLAGFGPNTRTIMQFRLSKKKSKRSFNLQALQEALPVAYTSSQPAPVVPETTYPVPYQASKDTYARIEDTELTYTPVDSSTEITTPMVPKSIIESFELNYGRMNAVLGTEMVFTNDGNQTSVPLNFMDPPTEQLADGTVQIWKITHNGVDTHAIHTHLFNMQLINRVGWDGMIKPPDANELGWKETIRMNPLEDVIVAMRPVKPQNLPFVVPLSYRPWDPTAPPSAIFGSFDPYTGAAVTWSNADQHAFGWEYVWHCHLLGHEENDMMRPVVFNLVPEAPTVTATAVAGTVTLTITPPSTPGLTALRYEITETAPAPTIDSGRVIVVSPPSSPVNIPVTSNGVYIYSVQIFYTDGVSTLSGFPALNVQVTVP